MTFKTLANIVFIMATLSGCTYKTRPQQSPNAPAIATTTIAVDPQLSKENDFSKKSNFSESEILSGEVALLPENKLNSNLIRSLQEYNISILNRAAKNQDISASLKLYAATLTIGCDAKLIGCRALRYFSKSEYSYKVAMLIAERFTSDHQNYYNYLKLAYSIKNARFDYNLSLMFLRRAATQISDPQFLHTLQTVLSDVSLNASPEQAKQAIALFNPLTLSRKEGSVGASLNFTKLLEASAKLGLLYESIESIILKIHSAPGSFKKDQDEIIKQNSRLLTSLGVSTITRFDEVFFLIDRIYNGDLNPDDGLALWQGVRGENKHLRLVDAVEKYIKIRFIKYLNKTNSKAKEVYSTKVSSDRILDYALSHSYEVSSIWSEFRAHVKPLTVFVLAALKGDHANKQLLDRATGILDGFEKNIKYSSVYPHMIMLSYYMSLKDFKKDFKTRFGAITIDSTLLIEELFAGKSKISWFDYAEDTQPLDPAELLYALDIAVKTGALEAFNIDPDEFLQQIFTRLGAKTLLRLENYRSYYKQLWATSSNFKEVSEICQSFNGGRKVKRKVPLDAFQTSPFIANLQLNFIDGNSGIEEGKAGISIYGSNPTNMLELMRQELPKTERQFNAMAAIFKGHYSNSDLKNTNAEIQRIIDLKNGMGLDFLNFHKNIGTNCPMKFQQKDFSIAISLIQTEELYLRQVYRDIKMLQTSKDSEVIQYIQRKYQKSDTGLARLDRVRADGFLYNSFDLVFRLIKNLRTIDPGIEINVPSDLTGSNVYLTNVSKLITELETEEDFVLQGLNRAFFANGVGPFVNWYTRFSSRNYSFNLYMGTLFSLYKMGSVQTPEGTTVAMPAAELIRTAMAWFDVLKLDPTERALLQRMNVIRKFNPIHMAERLYRYDGPKSAIIEVYGLFDFLLDGSQQEVLGSDFNIELNLRDGGPVSEKSHIGSRKAALDYFNARSTKSDRIYFKTTESLERTLYDSYRLPVQMDQKLSNSFYELLQNSIAEIERLPRDQQPRYDVDLRTTIQSPFLTHGIRENYQRNILRYHQSTENCFNEGVTTCAAFR